MKYEHYWTYRLVRTEGGIQMCEVYFTNDKATGWCNATPWAENLEDLTSDLDGYLDALAKPIMHEVKDELVEETC